MVLILCQYRLADQVHAEISKSPEYLVEELFVSLVTIQLLLDLILAP